MSTSTPAPKRRDRSNRGKWWNLKRRRWAYGVATAAVPVATIYGLVNPDQGAALAVLAGALLGVTGLALTHPSEDAEG